MASILLISREPRTVSLVRATLTIAGHEVFVADHPSGARRNGRRRFQLVLLDAALIAVADGLDELSNRIALLCSASTQSADEDLRVVGAQGHIRDLTPRGLLDGVTRYLAARL
jgi:DNA-binding response OmpR family regulator